MAHRDGGLPVARTKSLAWHIVASGGPQDAVILFDDMQTDWKSFGALNKALTSATTTERLLGSSRTATARTNVLFLGTGNNIEPEHDMRRRVVSIRLEPLSATPTLTEFAEEGPVEHTQSGASKQSWRCRDSK